ncbi:MAG: hypothetical protein ACYTG0_09410 [Planctomycetota bacterium]
MERPHWDYYLALVDDIRRIARFVEITKENYDVYSIELARILLAAGSEVDVVAKLLCHNVAPSATVGNINEYRTSLLGAYPSLPTIRIALRRYGIALVPWQEWADGKNPDWWRSYNNVKHRRNTHFAEASLINTLSATAGLCVLVTYLYHDFFESTVIKKPLLFLAEEYKTDSRILFGVNYKLPDF